MGFHIPHGIPHMTCDTFSTLVSTVDMEFDEVNWDGVLCCHCRLLKKLSEKVLKLNIRI